MKIISAENYESSKHEDELDDRLKKQRIHHIREGPPKTETLKYNSCIEYNKDEKSRGKYIEVSNNKIKSIVEHGAWDGWLQKGKHANEPYDPLKKLRINHIPEGIPIFNQLNHNSGIKYIKDKKSRVKWIDAYNSQIESIFEHGTWHREPVGISTVDRDNMIGIFFVFGVKSDGGYKCRLVARGDT